MGYYYGRYRRRRNGFRRAREVELSHSQTVSGLYGGIDADVRQMFFALDAFTLKLVFNKYEAGHGEGKRKYAETTFRKWKSGEVQMGGEISDRLVRLVPPFLSFEQKYELLKKLWDRLRQKAVISVTISPQGGIEAALACVMDAVARIEGHQLPSAVVERLHWLADNDSVTAQGLLNQVARREAEIAAQTVESELRLLLAVAAQHADKIVTGTRTVNLPGATVQIHVNQSPISTQGRSGMTNEKDQPKDPSAGQIERSDSSRASRELAAFQNPNDLLGEALRRMSPAQQEQVVGKATNELLRLQVKTREGQIDHEMASTKVDTAADAAQRLGQTGHEFEVRAEHRSEHGSVQVTVKNKRASLSERVGGCFVATACFGDFDHPTVVVLRQFRDRVLIHSRAGRCFVDWYYQHGPVLARLVEPYAFTRAAGRLALIPLVLAARALLALRTKSPR